MELILEPYNSLYESGISFIRKLIKSRPVKRPMPLISKYAEAKRMLPLESPFPGLWRNSKTPYLIEIMDMMSPYSPAQHVRFMKCAQVGATAAAENIMAYWMDEYPAPIMVTSATDETIKDWMELRAEPVIDSCGFRHKIVANINVPKSSRRSGDKSFLKEYVGGFLTIASAQAAARLRSKSIRILMRDEIDGAPEQLRTGEGNWLDVSAARLSAWGSRGKIFDFSTPVLYHTSSIYKLYKEGDRRVYLVPCPYCGTKQELKLGDDKTQYGLKPITKAGRLIDVVYMCEKCHESIHNYHKHEMLNAGNWEITAPEEDKINPSYHISGLYSPIGMVSWIEIWRQYEKAQDEPDAMRSFITLRLGQPYKEAGNKPSYRELIHLRGGYKAETTIPNGVLYLVAGIDVQAGSKKNEDNPPRLEMEIMGMGPQYKTWSIVYKVFKGALDDPTKGAWEKLSKYLIGLSLDGGKPFKDEYGRLYKLDFVLIDSGDGNYTATVYNYTQTLLNIFPSKGASKPIQRKPSDPIIDIDSYTKDKPYERKVFKEQGTVLYRINTVRYKKQLYRYLRLSRPFGTKKRGYGFCDFPNDYKDSYFKMLTAEEQLEDGSFHCPSGRRNEALDCRVMCLCAADVYLDILVEREQQIIIENRQTTVVDRAYIIKRLTQLVKDERELIRQRKNKRV